MMTRVRRVLADAARRVRGDLAGIRVTDGETPSVRVLHGVKLYREVRIGDITYRGSGDSVSRPIDYIFDMLPQDGLAGRTVLDLGTAGGAVCFGAIRRGARHATGVEIADWRIRGAKAVRKLAGVRDVDFVQGDFFAFLQGRRLEFDVVFVLNVLHHLANPYPLLRRIARAASEYIVAEMPEDAFDSGYTEYNEDLLAVEGAALPKSVDDLVRFLAAYDFMLVQRHASSSDTKFFWGDDHPRSVYVFRRHVRQPTRDERLADVSMFRAAREESYRRARADAHNVDVPAGTDLSAVLHREFGTAWDERRLNVVVAGPRGAGKTYWAESLGPGSQPPYNPKIFKFPNADSRQGLRRHLAPSPGEGGTVAQVMVSTADDEQAHCTAQQLAASLQSKPVICLLLNVGFDQHFERLHRREVKEGQSDNRELYYDVSLRFDCVRFIEAFNRHGIAYRVLTVPEEPAGS